MAVLQRELSIITSMGRRYSGKIDIPSETFRTTDLLNSSNVYWRNPDEKCYENALMMHDVTLYVDDFAVYKRFERIQIKISEVIYFYDELENVGDEGEKKRASFMVKQSNEKPQQVNILTRMAGTSFYDISGTFYGLFRKKSRDKFFPLTQTHIVEIYKKQEKWTRKEIALPHKFIGVNNAFVESVTIG
ncbi:MAG: hypothetical protein R6T92_03405 [Desulfosalsimonadaceae bacterium]